MYYGDMKKLKERIGDNWTTALLGLIGFLALNYVIALTWNSRYWIIPALIFFAIILLMNRKDEDTEI